MIQLIISTHYVKVYYNYFIILNQKYYWMEQVDHLSEKMEKYINKKVGDYLIKEFLGKGAFGNVYKAIDVVERRQVAIKVLDLAQIQKTKSEYVRNVRKRLAKTQPELMMKCNSENVLKCYGIHDIVSESLRMIILEYCNGGDLEAEITKKQKIPENEAKIIFKQLMNGLVELHKNGIVHRDLKAENIFIHNGVYKIADFGFSKMVISQVDINGTSLGTMSTMAPEVMDKKPYGLKADIWSLGVIFYQLLAGKTPFDSINHPKLMVEHLRKKSKQIVRDNTLGTKDNFSAEVVDLIKKMLSFDSKERASWEDIRDHPFFHGKENQDLPENIRMDIDIRGIKLDVEKNVEQRVQEILSNITEVQEREEEREEKEQEIIQFYDTKVTQLNMNEVSQVKADKSEEIMYRWVEERLLECYKTELIIQKIILPLQRSDRLNYSRNQVQFLYLLSARCFLNISPIKHKLQKQKSPILNQIDRENKVKNLYKISKEKKTQYQSKLYKKESQLWSMIGDRFSRTVWNSQYQQKQRILAGNEGIDFTKQQQIDFTTANYIKGIIQMLKSKKCTLLIQSVIKYLQKYDKICKIQYDPQNNVQKFKDKVDLLINSR